MHNNVDHLRPAFSREWASHHCDKPGCGVAIIADGGLKSHR